MIAKVNHFSVFVTYCICTILPLCVSAQQQSYDEYALKTAFLYRSLHYIEWPAIPTNKADTTLTICAVSGDAFSSTIKSLHFKAVNQHKIIVKTFAHYKQMHGCQVVYIGKNASDEVFDFFATKNVLTVSDYPGFIEDGGIINFPLQEDKVGIEINNDEAVKHNLKISAKLLRIAIVKNYPNPTNTP
ncbi:MAG: YfiR family protein [Gammaproteobacteria bacterium]|jgi:hypothetical protein